MPDADDYTVGWICAVEIEYVAARIFLDEIHDAPAFISQNDDNTYTLGKIGPHLVVIAVSPDGEYGINTAAAVARNMMHSFPNIRIGLMVGIGGGVPSDRHDIRLGDIVVSAPRNGYGGVFQYDYWKAIQDQDFESVGILNQPPTLLRTTVNHLKAVYQAEGHGIEEAISQALDRKPRIKKTYGRPRFDSDQLYESDFIHPVENDTGCEGHSGLDTARLVQRTPRGEYEDNPVIHYGLIASGNQLMKDATIRDQLAREKDVLCFEMEAAGLMNHFPCLVIRGICDYSDSHKSKEWQGYAAMAAAAYTRDLLLNIAPTRVQAEKKLRDVVDNIAVTIEVTRRNTTRLVERLADDEKNEELDWLTPFDHASVQRKHFSKSLAGTCQWFLDSNNFHQWLDKTNQTLFCTGIPGAGKTVLTSIVVDYLQERFREEPSSGFAYLYCEYERQDEQTPDQMFASILKQLAQRYHLVYRRLYDVSHLSSTQAEFQGTTKPRAQPRFDEILECLTSTIELFSKVYIVIDGLDEFQASRGRRSVFLKTLLALQKDTGINILATSRKLADIQNYFKESVTCEIAADEGDIQRYVEDQLQHMPDFVQSDVTLQNKIQTTISQNTRGMFIVATAHLETLMEQPTVGDLELALLGLPLDPHGIYTQSYQRIERKSRESRRLAERALALLHARKCPEDACILQQGVMRFFLVGAKEQIFQPSIDMMTSLCEGLLSYDRCSGQFSLSHRTLEWYLDQKARDTQSSVVDKTRPKFIFGASGDKSTDDIVRLVAATLTFNLATSGDVSGETKGETRSVDFLGNKSTGVCPNAKNEPILERNMSWMFLSRGSYRLGES
ncbi:hypothetical protein NCS52_00395500 [Fusarium sp. LHS14.1]|nr:hypothetical protein NCS52_00395500 [Fusarium sp. LHS14.1]